MTAPSRDAVREPGPEIPVPVPLLAVVLLLFASSALRFRGIFLDPTFWAEDGTFFFRNSVEIGPSAILSPVYGSYYTLIRLVAFLISFFPTYWAPLLYAVAAGMLASVSLSLFSRAGYRWLVPDDRVRVLVCWLFSLVPGTYESFFALSPGTYAVFCALVLLLLERDGQGRWQMGIGRALLVSLLWFSLGQGLVLAPLVAYLFWLTRNRNYLVLLVTLAGAVLLNLTTQNAYRPDSLPAPGLLALIYFENLAVRLAFISLVPYRWHDVVRKMESAPFLLLSLALIGSYLWAAFRARRRDAEGARVLVLAVLCVMATYPLTALARNYGVAALTRATGHPGGPGRPGSGRAGAPPPLAVAGPPGGTASPEGRRDRTPGLDHVLRPSRTLLPATEPARCAARGVAGAGRDHRRGPPRAASRHAPGSSGDTQDPLPSRSPDWKIKWLTIAPNEEPSPSRPPPPRR